MRNTTKTSLLYLFPAVAVAVIWYILLFTSIPSNRTPVQAAGETLEFLLTEGPRTLWFVWLFALPPIFLAMALAYLTPAAASRRVAVALFVVGCGLALASWLTVASEVAIFATLPLWYGFANVRSTSGPRKNGT